MIKLICILLVFSSTICYGQETSEVVSDTISNKEKIKSGWSIGAIPAIGYDSDIGFKYGGVVNLYHYGDGTIYPKYKHFIFLEWTQSSKGSGIKKLKYDSEYLIPGIRITSELGYYSEQALDFYGFNGFEAVYNPDFVDGSNENYISRMYYRHKRNLLRLTADFQGKIGTSNFHWNAGIGLSNSVISTVDIAKLNEGKDSLKILPDTALLYDKYVEWGIIGENEKDGGFTSTIKLGFIYDTRDNEANPMSGMWTEALIVSSPAFLGNKDYPFTKLILTQRQYFTLITKKLSFTYRIMYEGTIAGRPAFYMQPFVYSSTFTTDGVGGSKSIRGIMRNRMVGDGFTFGNFEFRWKFLHVTVKKQNVYLALNPFFDAGKVLQDHKLDQSSVPPEYIIKKQNDRFHCSYGLGLRTAINENFVLAIDYGRAINPNDGESGLYINMGFLY